MPDGAESRPGLLLMSMLVRLLFLGGLALVLTAAGSGRDAVGGRPAPPDPTTPAYWHEALRQAHAPGEVLVHLRAPRLQAQDQPAVLATAELLSLMPELGLAHYRVRGDLATALAALNRDPAVGFAEPNYRLWPAFEPDDPYYRQYAANDGIANGGYLNRLRMAAAWDITRGHPAILVAVIDSGIDLEHEDIRANLWRNPGEVPANGRDDDGNGFVDDVYGWNFAADSPDVDDWLGHGSHVAGIIAAHINNGLGVAGVAPKTRVMAVGVFAPPGYGTFADEIQAILYATDQGADVINLSLGSTAYSRGEEMAVNYAVRRGVVVVAAAGNNGRAVYHWPAAHPAAIAVTATTARDAIAGFSNRGDFVDLAAPGVAIWSLRRGGGYLAMSGTSMATPHVAGVAALILARNPTLTPAEVRAILETTATDLGAVGRDEVFGYGRVDALAALQSTPPYTGTVLPDLPDWLRARTWPAFCREWVAEGDFETDPPVAWQLDGAATLTTTVALSGTRSLYLGGEPGQQASARQTFIVPSDLQAATLAFGLRLENEDYDLGNDPQWPGRDRLSVWLRTSTGEPLLELLRAGNADYNLAAGLPWDRYLHVLNEDEIALLAAQGRVQIDFTAMNDTDPRPTRFYIDDVRLCGSHAPVYLPRLRRSASP
jgi:subtilisin family serine protease